MSIILGIDPGLATVGFGVVKTQGQNVTYLDCGVIRTEAGLSLEERLSIIKTDMKELIESIKPDAVGIEELFFAKNVTNAIKVAHARGVLVQLVHEHKLPIFNFTPLQVKNNITGYGNADKQSIQIMVQRLLSLPDIPKPDDAADGLAIAICAGRVFESKAGLQ